MAAQGDAILARSGVPADERRIARQADVRYAGQGHEIRIDLPDGQLGPHNLPSIRETFETVYRSLFGRTGPDVPLEGVSWRVLAACPRPVLRFNAGAPSVRKKAVQVRPPVYFPEGHEPAATQPLRPFIPRPWPWIQGASRVDK